MLKSQAAKIEPGPFNAKDRLQVTGFLPAPTTPEEHNKILREQIEMLSKVVRDSGLRK